jgi:hypothetical protein
MSQIESRLFIPVDIRTCFHNLTAQRLPQLFSGHWALNLAASFFFPIIGTARLGYQIPYNDFLKA